MALSLALTLPGAALPQSEAYLYGPDKTSIPAPAPYQVRAVYDGLELGVGRLREPQDLHVDGTGAIYLADTGNNRIVRIRADFQSADVLTAILIDGREEPLSQPKGVFKAADGLLYICDTGNARIVAVNEKREAVRIMTNEGITAINTHIQYTPEKVAVDTDGNVFVVDPSIYQGIVQYDAQDRFLGFFAPNEVKVTADVLFLQMWKKWFSTEQVESMEKSLPSPYSNLYIDRDNFLYTSSAGAGAGKALKHLNMLGVNILQPAEKKFGHGVFGDLEVSYDNGEEVASAFVDVCVTESGLLCGADATRGRLFLYDADCNLVAIWGGSGQRRGTFKALAAVERQGDSFLALDSEKASLTVFEPTAYMRRVLDALTFYSAGKYIESVERWQEILRENSHLSIAYKSIGRAYFQQGDSAAAMEMLKKGDDPYFYSMALKDYRKEFVRRHFVWLLLGAAAGLTLFIFLIKKAHRWMLSGKSGKRIRRR
ncbi:hypothetical protein [Anaeromassilibacillus sp. SJQ-5]